MRRRYIPWAWLTLMALASHAGAGPGPTLSSRGLMGEWVSLAAVARENGLILTSREENGLVFESRQRSPFQIQLDSRRVQVEGTWVWLSRPVLRMDSGWMMSRTDAVRIVGPLLQPRKPLAKIPGDWATVVIDPGHGGVDSGAVSPGGVEEKTVTLMVAQRVRDRLQAAGVHVVMTRESDEYLDLDQRAKIAETAHPFAFVSIHLNAAPSSSAKGIETYVLTCEGQASTNARDISPAARYAAERGNRWDAANRILGYSLQQQLVRKTGAEDRGLRSARFQVLKTAGYPAALVECAFLSNGREGKQLRDEGYLATLAESIALGIVNFRAEELRARLLCISGCAGAAEIIFKK